MLVSDWISSKHLFTMVIYNFWLSIKISMLLSSFWRVKINNWKIKFDADVYMYICMRPAIYYSKANINLFLKVWIEWILWWRNNFNFQQGIPSRNSWCKRNHFVFRFWGLCKQWWNDESLPTRLVSSWFWNSKGHHISWIYRGSPDAWLPSHR